MFQKHDMWILSARPAIYDADYELVKESKRWRVVRTDLTADVDWTYEREWRLPDQYKLNYPNVMVFFAQDERYRDEIINYCRENKLERSEIIMCPEDIMKHDYKFRGRHIRIETMSGDHEFLNLQGDTIKLSAVEKIELLR